MRKPFHPLLPAALCVSLACLSGLQGQEKTTPDPAAQKGKAGKGKGTFGAGGKSPEVQADGTVIFRLPLPNLQKVELDGDFKERFTKGTIPMAKDAKTGAWTASVKVPPGSYQY